MNADESAPPDDPFTSWLVACDQALAAGQDPPDVPGGDTPPQLPPYLQGELACLRLLRQAIRRQSPAGAAASPPGLAYDQVGRFEIRRELGRGSFGVVFLAYDPQLRRAVALKVPRPEALVTPELRERLVREARAAAVLHHPNVVPVHEAGEAGPVCYIVSEYCPGVTLAAWLKELTQPVPVRLAAALVATLAEAVGHAHLQGVVHRDLKPSNVLLQPRPESKAPSPESALQGPGAGRGAAGPELPFTPKVTDFGLAKFTPTTPAGPAGDREDQTQSGQIVGTPLYMAPEQASGKSKEVGPAADIYALGVILYEVLVGRPPFRGETPLDTREQVRSQEPVPPRRLRPKVPRDLETICLKCLQKEPARRYAGAEGLAEDLRRFQAGAPIRARPVGRLEHLVKWARRQPAAAALWGVSLTAVLVLGLGGLWWAWQRAEQRRAVHEDLEQVATLLQAWRLPEAETAMGRAEGRVAGGGPADLLRRVHQVRKDLTLVDALDRIRLAAATLVEGRFDYASADQDYARLFREQGLAAEGEDPAAVAARVQGSAVRAQVVAALDHWATQTGDPGRRAWLLEVARRAEPGDWSDRFRDPAVWGHREALGQLAREAKVAELSPQLLTALGLVLRHTGADPVPLLTAAQERHPTDFWLNFDLGNALAEAKREEEAAGYYRAALAVRPDTAVVHNNLGGALSAKGRPDDAVREHRRALELNPKYAKAHYGLANALRDKGRLDDAIQKFRTAIALDPKGAWAHNNLGAALAAKAGVGGEGGALDGSHNNLGNALRDKGLLDEAIEAYRRAIDLDPKDAWAHTNLGIALRAQGLLDDAIAEHRQAIALDPKLARAHYNLGNALRDKPRWDGAIEAYRRAIDLDPKDAWAHTNLGIALANKGRPDDAIQAFRQAIALDPKLARAHYNLGTLLRAQGLLVEAIREYQKATDLDPKLAPAHGALGQALLGQGRFAEAQAATRRCLDLLPKDDPSCPPVTEQLRQCERWLVLSNKLPAVLQGDDRPRDAGEQLALAELCQQHKQLHAAATRFYAAAFADQPKLVGDMKNQHRYDAACAAALAAAGRGKDADQLDDQERARLRRQALDWLRADLTRWAAAVDKGPPQGRAAVQRTLRHWQTDPDLAGLRDAVQLVKLPQAEWGVCLKLWTDVEALLKRAQGNP
jgi:serine/threonine-protein kinase